MRPSLTLKLLGVQTRTKIHCNTRYFKNRTKYTCVWFAYTGPLPKTVVDFWRMVWQERSQSIVMLANLVEGNRKKCHQYWPETGTLSFGPFDVTIFEQQTLAAYTIRHLSVQVANNTKLGEVIMSLHVLLVSLYEAEREV